MNLNFCFILVILNLQLSDLTTIATVGSGGFGRVMLVSHTNGEDVRVFALKKMKKCHILQTKQEEHTFNEKKILLSCMLTNIVIGFQSLSLIMSLLLQCHLHLSVDYLEHSVILSLFIC